MFERIPKSIILFALVLPAAVSHSDRLTLRDGSLYSGLSLVEYDGASRTFLLEKAGRSVKIPGGEIDHLDLEAGAGGLMLFEGSVYSNLDIHQFDLLNGQLKVGRGGKTIDLPLSEIERVWIGERPVVIPSAAAEATAAVANETQSATTETRDASGDAQWREDGLYTNLPDDFGKKQMIPPGSEGGAASYTPRWKAESAGKDGGQQSAAPVTKSAPAPTAPPAQAQSAAPTAPPARHAPAPVAEPPKPERGIITGGSGRVENETPFGAPPPASPGGAPRADWRRRR